MKRKSWYLLPVIGLGLWLWIGSYVYLRQFKVSPWSRFFNPPHTKFIHTPKWAKPLTPAYRPLTIADSWFTGEKVQFDSPRLHIDATANF